MKTSFITLTIGWVGAVVDLNSLKPGQFYELLSEPQNPGIELAHRFLDPSYVPRKSDGPDAVGLDIEVWVSEGLNPRAQYLDELFVYHRCPELPGYAKDIDELFEQVKRGIWIKLHPEEFQGEILQALGRDKLKELHCKAFVPGYLSVLKELGGPLTMREIQEETDIVGRASKGSDPELEAVLEQVAQAPDCKICGHKMQKSGATYECSNCGE